MSRKGDLTPEERLSLSICSTSPAQAAYSLTHLLMVLAEDLKAASEDASDGLPLPGDDPERESREWNRLAILCESTATLFDNLAPSLTHFD